MHTSFTDRSMNASGISFQNKSFFFEFDNVSKCFKTKDLMNSSFTLQEVLSEMMDSLASENERLEGFLAEKLVGKDELEDVERNVKVVENALKKFFFFTIHFLFLFFC